MRRRRRLCAAVAVLGLSGVGAAAGAAAPARAAAAPQHVAIVVAGVGTACVAAGGTGLQLLSSAFQVTIGRSGPTAGMVLEINGVGSANVRPNYWSYWHGAGSGWSYSSTGPAGVTPSAGSVEGWAFGAYASGDQPPLGEPDYATLCAGKDPAPKPTPTAKPAARTSTAHPSAAPSAVDTHAVAPSSQPAHAAGPTPGPVATEHRSSTVATTPAPSPPVTTTPAGPTSPLATPAAAERKAGTSAVPAVGTVIGLLVAVSIGAAAYWRARRNRLGG